MSKDKFNCPSYDGSSRDVGDSIDKRNAAVMALEQKHRKAVAALQAIEKFAEANNLQPYDGFDKIRDMAREALK